MNLEVIKNLQHKNETKIVYLVMDGLGGLPRDTDYKTELEAATKPNLDNLAAEGICGLHEPVGPGITPGSGPGHLALFGYDPLKYQIGRGALSALGINFDLQKNDIAARGNFCTVDDDGRVTDRRAGRLSTDKNRELCKLLKKIQLPQCEFFIETVKEHRFLFVMRREGLSSDINDTDPQETGKCPLEPTSSDRESEVTIKIISEFINQARKLLKDHHPSNMVLLRGFSALPDWPSFNNVYGLNAAAIAGYPMYRGVARLLGMDVLETDGSIDDEIGVLEKNWNTYDFFFLHVKGADSAGEDGDFFRKESYIRDVDTFIPRLRALNPDVIVVTGDHSTPSVMKHHSWHPVPIILWSKHCRSDQVTRFGERDCLQGALGVRLPGKHIMPLVMANAERLSKFGA